MTSRRASLGPSTKAQDAAMDRLLRQKRGLMQQSPVAHEAKK